MLQNQRNSLAQMEQLITMHIQNFRQGLYNQIFFCLQDNNIMRMVECLGSKQAQLINMRSQDLQTMVVQSKVLLSARQYGQDLGSMGQRRGLVPCGQDGYRAQVPQQPHKFIQIHITHTYKQSTLRIIQFIPQFHMAASFLVCFFVLML